MLSFSRHVAFSALALAMLAACGNASGDDTSSAAGAPVADTGLPDMILGDPEAPVTLIEYASITCGHCAEFHANVLPHIKARYVDTGQVRFIFREFPTPPANVAVAGFALARCAGPDQYFDVIGDMFESQPGIMMAARQGAVRPALQSIAARHGIEGDEAFEACITDREIREDIADVIISGDDYGVNSTPTLILQGQKLENTIQSRTPEGLSQLIDIELAALGIEIAAPEPAPVEETPEPAAVPEAVPTETEAETETAPQEQ